MSQDVQVILYNELAIPLLQVHLAAKAVRALFTGLLICSAMVMSLAVPAETCGFGSSLGPQLQTLQTSRSSRRPRKLYDPELNKFLVSHRDGSVNDEETEGHLGNLTLVYSGEMPMEWLEAPHRIRSVSETVGETPCFC